MKRFCRCLLGLLVGLTLVACASSSSSSTISYSSSSSTVTTLNTDQTDALKLRAANYQEMDFIEQYAGEVSLLGCVDGDTANFRTLNKHNVTIRFLGIDTPESTALVQPWGKAASDFTCKALMGAHSIVIEAEVAVSGFLDSTGSRYLAWVWYQSSETSDYRNLNLELVEQAYTKDYTATGSAYYSYFRLASDNARHSGRRVYGEDDPNYDATPIGVPVTAYEVVHNYDAYGPSATLVKITGLVVAKSAYSVYIRDVVPTINENGEEEYAGLYVYGGYSSDLTAFAKVGRIISFYGRPTKYNGAIQISDVKTKSTGDYAYTIISSDNEITQIPLDLSKDLTSYYGQFVTTNVLVEQVVKSEDSIAFTVYGKLEGTDITVSIFANAKLYPMYQMNRIEVGSVYQVSAGWNPGFASQDYDMVLGDNTNSDYANFKKIKE
ncbi:MAG: thermonuclease family protein [Bacilli bacterium]|nr:thermonuclease family protein [Bacilli bacterium]MDD3422150.1 thermonuclease family protein [Bacilli bacterium]MDD4065462.1 thermonuclease family protein [Bacilli bacterium]